MFKKKKLYEVTYRLLGTYTTIVSAKDEHQAVQKIYRMNGFGAICEILSIKEYHVADTGDK